MHRSFCDGLSAVYPQSASVADPRRNCTTQSGSAISRSADLPSVDSSLQTPSPDFHSTNTIQVLRQQQQQTTAPATSFPALSFNSGFQQYPQPCPHPQLRSSSTSSLGMWPTPPSTTYEGDDIDGYSYQSSPMSATSAANPSLQLSTDPSTASPRSWSSPEAQQLSFSQGFWSADRMPPYDMQVYTPATYEDQFQQPMALAAYPQPRFGLRNDNLPEDANYHREAQTMAAPTMPEGQAPLPSQATSPPMKEEFESYQMPENGSTQDPGHADASDGEEGSKVDEPYARLIWRAFMSRDRHAMTLQEIYQWFRDNTEKTKSESKGWQNSIRHNLSMNAAFVKRDRRPTPSDPLNDAGEPKKSTEWVLEDWAVIDGVQSTTRYRKGNPGRRAGSGSHGRLHGNPSARASSGRKGGLSASRARAAYHKRHALHHQNHTQLHHGMPNAPFLNSQREPMHDAFYTRPLGYHYDSSTRDDPITPPETNIGDNLFHEPMNGGGISTVGSTPGYAYGNHAQPSQTVPGYYHQQRPEAMYAMNDVTGGYQGPAAHMPIHAQGSTPALPSNSGAPFANADEINDNKGGYLHWGGSATGGTYQP
ncbi:hypothetical protein F4775DRAFT_605699 [Biscogniauxia sp. FL1348]|nr:hypothetical protein F4775DRAFT_605699 [Biscogniauxia sp. FL1348]